MKILIVIVALTIPLMAGIMFTGYQSSTHKKEVVLTKVQDVSQDLNAVQEDTNSAVQKVLAAEEWKTFNKNESELKIKTTEMRITGLNIIIRKPAELFDAFYLKKITALEEENRFLKARLEAYVKSQSKMGNN
jgi:outer membrane murein-binding lipoprotein Lpp